LLNTLEFELLRNLFRKRATILYPFEPSPPPKGFRGKHKLDLEKCIGCGLCARVCPTKAIEMEEKNGRKLPVIHLYKCMFCGECADLCPRKAIELTEEFEIAGYTKEELILRFA